MTGKLIQIPEHTYEMLNWEIHWARQTAILIATDVIQADKVVVQSEQHSKQARKVLKVLRVEVEQLLKVFEIRREIALRSTPAQVRADKMYSIFTTEVEEQLRGV